MSETANPELEGAYQDQIKRADEAKRLMGNPLMVAAFDELHEEIHDLIWDGDNDPARLAECVRAGKLLRMIQDKLKEHIETGELAGQSLEMLEGNHGNQP